MNLPDLLPLLRDELAAAQRLRRQLHSYPQLSGHEHDTCELVLSELKSAAGDAITTIDHVADTGAVLTLDQPGTQGAAVALRAELDALPVTEHTGVDWASQSVGVMHACGHDVHLAAVVCATRVLIRAGLPAPLAVLLQPREETSPSGAADLLAQSPALRACRAVIAAHVQPSLARGETACVEGIVNSSSDEFTIVVTGSGGHAAYPHLANDPIHVAAHLVLALNVATARLTDPTAMSVLTVTHVAAGTTTNVVPDSARIAGTIRAATTGDRERLTTHVRQAANSITAAFGCHATVRIDAGEPPLRNDPALARRTAGVLASAGTEVNTTLRSAGADDFAFYSEHLPSLMMFVGVEANPAVRRDQRLHDAAFLPGDEAIRDVAIALLAGYLGACAAN
jgi:amidohydrolase